MITCFNSVYIIISVLHGFRVLKVCMLLLYYFSIARVQGFNSVYIIISVLHGFRSSEPPNYNIWFDSWTSVIGSVINWARSSLRGGCPHNILSNLEYPLSSLGSFSLIEQRRHATPSVFQSLQLRLLFLSKERHHSKGNVLREAFI